MAFKIALSKTYFWPIKAHVAADGRKSSVSFDAEFRRMSQTELEAMQSHIGDGELTDRALAADLMVGWKGIQDESGQEIPFSESMRDALLDIAGMGTCIVESWSDSIRHGAEKN